MKLARLIALLVLVSAATTPAIATANDRPLADAGLDQTVTRGTSAYLDAGGSRDPDGAISTYQWTIETPSGTTTTPDCSDCERTVFQPNSVGTYEVTLTVTDDDGATATDTLYVTVEPGSPPQASLAGPSRLTTGDQGTFSANLAAGAAPLDRAIWYVDGERQATTQIDGEAATLDQDARFPTNGTHEIRTVVVDQDDQRDDATRRVTVTEPSDSTGTDSASQPGAGSPGSATYVEGPRVVTGESVLEATYQLNDGSSARWVLDDATADRGRKASLTFSPGRHELYAVPDERDAGVATFSDGERTVVADPAPEVHLPRVVEESVVTVDAYATDELDNLESLTLFVDGEPRHTITANGIENRGRDSGQIALLERLNTLAPGEHDVTVKATDARGQTAVENATIHVPGPPEVITAGFVTDGPLSVYHPKLDPDRYTAKYRVKVNLNGVDPERVATGFTGKTKDIVTEPLGEKTRSIDNILVVTKKFASGSDGPLKTKVGVSWERGSYLKTLDTASGGLLVTKSKPVIRLELVNAENSPTGGRGAVFDASGSFDPDGTELRYNWSSMAYSEDAEGPIKQMDNFGPMVLRIKDRDLQVNSTTKMLYWFAPDLRVPSVKHPGPYYPNETVRYQVQTVEYELAKQTYEFGPNGSIDFDLRVDGGDITGHRVLKNEEAGGSHDKPADSKKGQSYIVHQWNVTIPAGKFLKDSPDATIFPVKRPQAEKSVDIPSPEVYKPLETNSNISRIDIRYLAQVTEYQSRQTSNPVTRDALKQMGYSIYSIRETGTAYHLEKRVKTQSAKWETQKREFGRERTRTLFLGAHPTWKSGGSGVRTQERTTTQTDWRSSKTGEGEFTGSTRRYKIEPAEYTTEKRYEYEKTVTYETTETYERTIATPVLKTKRNCVPNLGCRVYTVRETEYNTVEFERTVTKERTETRSYWSKYPRSPLHDWTGESRQMKTQDAKYETQYQYEISRTTTEETRYYIATHLEQVQEAQYDWQTYKTVKSERAKMIHSSQPGVRVGDTSPTTEWILRQKTGTKIDIVSEAPADKGDVLKTKIEAVVNARTKFRKPSDGLKTETTKRTNTVTVTEEFDGFVPSEEIKTIVVNRVNKSHGGYE